MTVNVPAACLVSWLTIELRHPALPGHFPGNPIVPGVVLLDHVIAFAQAGRAPQGVACRIPHAKFLKPLLPDQQVMLGLEAVSEEEVRFTCRIGAARVAEGALVFPRTHVHE